MAKPDAQRLVALQHLMVQFAAVNRRVRFPASLGRVENDVEHTYTLAMAAWFLAASFPELDRDRLIRLALAHDLLEVHAGDTFVFAKDDSLATKHEREAEAVEQLKQDWPDFPDLLVSIDEYERRESPEAKFVYALDKVMVVTLNILNGGASWHEHQVTFEQFVAEKEKKVPISPEIYAYYEQLRDMLIKDKQKFFG